MRTLHATPLSGLRLHPAVFTSEEEAHEEAKSRLRGIAEAQRLVDGFDAFFRAAVRDGRTLGAKEDLGDLDGRVESLDAVHEPDSLRLAGEPDGTVERLTAALPAKARLASP